MQNKFVVFKIILAVGSLFRMFFSTTVHCHCKFLYENITKSNYILITYIMSPSNEYYNTSFM